MNGHVEDFYYPLTAGEVIGKPGKQFLCTQAHLMSGYLNPLKPDTSLEANKIYFMLSYSTIQSESSPVDLAIMARRLIKLAKTSQPSSLSSTSYSTYDSSLGSESPGRSPDRSCVAEFGKVRSCKGLRSWKPVLDTIRESSFNHRSESDLREMH